ncbi:MAG TPA: L,D-transpeptidase family protein [Roseiarcus sp.]|jgi:murein L,D-transpeptidase YcbB/YkuD
MTALFRSSCAAALLAALGLAAPAAIADPAPATAAQGVVSAPVDAVNPPAEASAPPSSPASPEISPQLPPPLSPMSAAIQSALGAMDGKAFKTSPIGAGDWRAASEAIRRFYEARDHAPLWVDESGLTPAGSSALRRLLRADEDGLDLSAFALPKEPPTAATPERLGEMDVVLSEAVVAYAMQASGARIAPTRISPLITQRPTVAEPAAALTSVSAAADPGAALEAFNPPQRGYLDLRDQLSRLRAETPARPAPIPSGPSLGLGMADPRVPMVRERLGAPQPAEGKDPQVYDLRLAVAVAAFQRSHGLPATGALTPGTVEALSGGAASSRREARILANMEMWRWEPHAMGEERIEINIPDYSLRLMDGDTLVHEARVIVGKPDTPTPVFSNEMRYILVNPIWRVPDSIIKKEMEPKLAEDPDYLTRRGYEVTQVGDRLIVKQPPGEANALGRILFMFPNEHAVYLHDTPLRSLFASERRAFSHGCVRVEQPMRLAQLVMGSGWTVGRLKALIGKSERTVLLPHTIPIHLEYFTEFVDDSGALQDREDIYGITRRVAGTIAQISQD